MPRNVRYDFKNNWSGGVNTNVRPEHLGENQYPGAKNCQLRNIGGNNTILGTRPGLLVHTASKISAHTVLSQYEYRRYASGDFTGYHLAVMSSGTLKLIASNGTASDADASVPTPFSAGAYYPSIVTANNLVFIVNGQENKKFDGTNVQSVGIATPSAPTVTDSGVAGNPSGTYDFAISLYNSATGQESSRSGYNSVTVSSKKITVSWSAPSDSQVDYVRVHIRKGTLSGSFFRLITGVSPSVDSTVGGYAVATTSTTVDITDAQINALVNVSPTTTENDPPPVMDRICFHQSRLFGVDPTNPSTLIFSKLASDGVESFNPTFSIPVNPDDGDRITAIVSSSSNLLLVFKKNAIYGLVGTYPSWEISFISSSVGCLSHTSVNHNEGLVYFWSFHGPAVTDGTSTRLLAYPQLANYVDDTVLQFDLLNKAVVGLDDTGQRLLWAIPGTDDTRNTRFLPYSLSLGVFESELWEIIDCASMANVLNGDGVPRLYLGDYAGRIFKFDHLTFVDGVGSGTKSSTGATTSYTASTLTDSAATFITSGDGLAQLYVIVKNSDGTITQRKRIGSNTGTVLTLDSGETFDPVPDSTYTYYVGCIDVTFNFGAVDGNGTPFWKKQLEYFTFDIVPPPASIALRAHVYTNTGTVSDTEFTTEVTGSVWDTGVWDSAVWGGSTEVQHYRKRIGATARTYSVDLQVCDPDAPIAIVQVGVKSKVLTEKS